MSSSPLVVDLDENNDLEILIGRDSSGSGGMVLAWHHDGGLVSGWPQLTGSSVFDAPVAGDIDGDGEIEIVAGSDDAKVYAWEVDGTAVSGWPKATVLSVKGSPALANLDGDSALEVIVGDFGGNMIIWGRDYHELFLPLVVR